jgi:hypothetical protein
MAGRRRGRFWNLAPGDGCGSVRFDCFRRTAAVRGSFWTSARRPLGPTRPIEKIHLLWVHNQKCCSARRLATALALVNVALAQDQRCRGRLSAAPNLCRKKPGLETPAGRAQLDLCSRATKRHGTDGRRSGRAIVTEEKKILSPFPNAFLLPVWSSSVLKSSPSRGSSSSIDRFRVFVVVAAPRQPEHRRAIRHRAVPPYRHIDTAWLSP